MQHHTISRKDIDDSPCPFDVVFEFTCHHIDKLNNEAPSKFPPGVKLFYPIIELDSEIQNGGFSQYFANNTSEVTGEIKADEIALESLQAIGANEQASLLKRASDYWRPFAILIARDKRATINGKEGKATKKSLRLLDDLYYDSRDRMVDIANRYIRLNSDDFVYSEVGPAPSGDP